MRIDDNNSGYTLGRIKYAATFLERDIEIKNIRKKEITEQKKLEVKKKIQKNYTKAEYNILLNEIKSAITNLAIKEVRYYINKNADHQCKGELFEFKRNTYQQIAVGLRIKIHIFIDSYGYQGEKVIEAWENLECATISISNLRREEMLIKMENMIGKLYVEQYENAFRKYADPSSVAHYEKGKRTHENVFYPMEKFFGIIVIMFLRVFIGPFIGIIIGFLIGCMVESVGLSSIIALIIMGMIVIYTTVIINKLITKVVKSSKEINKKILAFSRITEIEKYEQLLKQEAMENEKAYTQRAFIKLLNNILK